MNGIYASLGGGINIKAWTTHDIPRLDGSVAVVTGANGGLGLETARELARNGALVVMGVRDLEKAENARTSIMNEIPQAQLEVKSLDLASLSSIAAFVVDLSASRSEIDLLINNAGVMGIPRLETADGFEMQFGTNHLGHFALTAQLMPALMRSAQGRIVTVTSTGRLFGAPVDPTDPHLKASYDPWRAYGQAKMANMHFGIELDRRLRKAGSRVVSVVAQPGYVNTDLQSTSSHLSNGGLSQRFFAATVRWVGMSPTDGARAQLRAATDPTARGGEFYGPRWGSNGPPMPRRYLARSARPTDLESLWDVSESETGVPFDVAALAASEPE